MAQGEEILFPFIPGEVSFWEPLRPLLEAHWSSCKSSNGGKLPFGNWSFFSGGMIKQKRKYPLAVQRIRNLPSGGEDGTT